MIRLSQIARRSRGSDSWPMASPSAVSIGLGAAMAYRFACGLGSRSNDGPPIHYDGGPPVQRIERSGGALAHACPAMAGSYTPAALAPPGLPARAAIPELSALVHRAAVVAVGSAP